jgi:hypothetical protein
MSDDLARDFLKAGTIQNDGFMNMGSRDLIELRDAAVVFIPRNAFIANILCHKNAAILLLVLLHLKTSGGWLTLTNR